MVLWRRMAAEESRKVVHRLREELAAAGREREAAALDDLLTGGGEAVYLKLRKRWYTPAEVAERVGVSARPSSSGSSAASSTPSLRPAVTTASQRRLYDTPRASIALTSGSCRPGR